MSTSNEKRSSTTNAALHDLKPLTLVHPLLNSIPPELFPRFDPVYVDHYNRYNVGRLHTHQVPIEEMRANPSKYVITYGRATGPDIYRITEQTVLVKGGEITVRIFEPAPKLDGEGKQKNRGAYLNFHGGGWVFGDHEFGHDYLKRMVHDLDGEVVAIDVNYRHAPENRYPTAIEDSWAALNWVRSKSKELSIDPDRLAVGGMSAGGHLSAVLAHLCRDNGFPLRLQVLTVPVVDMHSSFTLDGKFDRANTPYESYREMEFTPALPAARMEYFHRHWLGTPRPESSGEDWKISPIFAPNFANLASALVFTAELDVLRDEGEAYAEKLKAAGVEVEVIRVLGVAHSFSQLDDILDGAKMFDKKSIGAIGKALSA
ncbi:hypothetical protein AJ80_08619 [Polytolypa hystricis UAMH7299]|uniref:Alpha/beta hydrolase fold-3 domain-containing protein n=1 Tax=Polytolypa hystricis (strain UAMH7299) TaxID=1447883 RepID=A0A2B7X421_POLH7|nr:hypothetical protein AJ80_08619 [Polytolypa hystricis UAMH7299]